MHRIKELENQAQQALAAKVSRSPLPRTRADHLVLLCIVSHVPDPPTAPALNTLRTTTQEEACKQLEQSERRKAQLTKEVEALGVKLATAKDQVRHGYPIHVLICSADKVIHMTSRPALRHDTTDTAGRPPLCVVCLPAQAKKLEKELEVGTSKLVSASPSSHIPMLRRALHGK